MSSAGTAIKPAGAASRIWNAGAPRTFVRSGLVVLGATLVWHASNFAFNSVAARLLGPDGYSELAATVALLYIASPLLVSIQTMTSRNSTELFVAGDASAIRPLLRGTLARLALVAVAATALAAAISAPLARLLHLGSSVAIVIVVGGLAVSLLTHTQRGALQGTTHFGRYALSTTVEALTKVIGAALILSLVSRSVDGAVAAVPLAALATLAVNTLLLRVLPRDHPSVTRVATTKTRSLTTVGTFVLLAVLLSADVLAAKRFLPPAAAGLYAAISLCGKTTFFATSAVSLFLFPLFSAKRERDEDTRLLFSLACGGIAACSIAMATVYYAAPAIVLDPLFGSRYRAADPYLGQIAIAFGCYALMYLAATFLVAQKSRAGVLVLAAVTAFQLIMLLSAHRTIGDIVSVQVVVLAVGAAMMTLAAVASSRVTHLETDQPRTTEGTESGGEQRLVEAVRASFGDVPVLLCGSRATGAALSTSDYDVLVALPRRQIPFALRRLRKLDEALTQELGASVTINPLPAHLLRQPPRNLLLWKVAREGRVLAAPAEFILPSATTPPLDSAARFSYLLTALLYLLRDLATERLPDNSLSAGVAHDTHKALLHLLQLALMERGAYASTVGAALEELGDPHLNRLAAHIQEPEGWVEVRDLILDELARIDSRSSFRASLSVNARYAALAGLRGRWRLRASLSREPIDRRLAAIAVELARDVHSSKGPQVGAAAARDAVPHPLRRHAGTSWSSIRDLFVDEWSNAHPLLAQ